MDAILFSADPNIVKVDDAIKHLTEHDEVYWEVGFQIIRLNFVYPIEGFIHIKGSQVEYKTLIRDIVPFSRDQYENRQLAERIKPEPWLREYAHNINNICNYKWRNALILTRIEPFSCDTYSFRKYPDGEFIKNPPQGYIRVFSPEEARKQKMSYPGLDGQFN